jgi:WD40 repeat protein
MYQDRRCDMSAFDQMVVLLAGLALGAPGRDAGDGRKDATPRKLEGHAKAVAALAFSPDGSRLVSAGLDGAAYVWDVGAGKVTHMLKGHAGAVLAVAYAPDGKTLATAGVDKVIRLWDGKGNEVGKLEGHGGAVAALAFSGSGHLLASGGYDGTIRLWDMAKGKEVATLKSHKGRVTGLAFSPDGKRLVSGGTLQEAIDVGGNSFITGTADRLRLWDVAGRTEVRTLEARGSVVAFGPKAVLGCGLVPDIQRDREGVSLDGFDQLSVAEAETGKEVRAVKWRGSTLAFSADGKWIATGAGSYFHLNGYGMIAHNGVNGKNLDTRLRLWEADTGKERACLPEEGATVLAFTKDGKALAAGTRKGEVLLWSVGGVLRDPKAKPKEPGTKK